MTDLAFQDGILQLGSGNVDLDADTLKFALLDDGYSPDATDAHATIIANEVSGTGYTAGGATLTGVSWDESGNYCDITADDPSWTSATFTARYGYLYAAASSIPLALYDFGANQSVDAGTFTYAFSGGVAYRGRSA